MSASGLIYPPLTLPPLGFSPMTPNAAPSVVVQQVMNQANQSNPVFFNGQAFGLASGTIAQAAIAAMNVTPVTLVNAPGASRVLMPLALYVMCSIPTGSSWAGAPSIQIIHQTAAIQLQTGTTGTNFNAAGPRNTLVYNSTWSYDSITDAANQALQMKLSGAATPGGAGIGQFQWFLWFALLDAVARLA